MFLTQIVNGQVSELALCEECAKKKGLFDPQALAFAEKFYPEEFKNRVDQIVRELADRDKEKEERGQHDVLSACPVCHFPLEAYRSTGHLGCPDCYTFFAHELERDTEAPDAPEEPRESAPAQRRSLEQQLQKAIELENYELAASLRDQIKKLSDSSAT